MCAHVGIKGNNLGQFHHNVWLIIEIEPYVIEMKRGVFVSFQVETAACMHNTQ